jgi:hypothetical protein
VNPYLDQSKTTNVLVVNTVVFATKILFVIVVASLLLDPMLAVLGWGILVYVFQFVIFDI